MNSIAITKVDELKSEIARLSILEHEQRATLGYRFNSPSAIFASALTLFPKSAAAQSVADNGFFQQDFLSLISRFLIPLTLNKTIFRHSGFLVKLLVGLVSQKASGYVTEGAVEKLLTQGRLLFDKLFAKKEPEINHPYLKTEKPAN